PIGQSQAPRRRPRQIATASASGLRMAPTTRWVRREQPSMTTPTPRFRCPEATSRSISRWSGHEKSVSSWEAGHMARLLACAANAVAAKDLVAPEPIEEGATAGRLGWSRGRSAEHLVAAVGPTRLLARKEHVGDRQQPGLSLLRLL